MNSLLDIEHIPGRPGGRFEPYVRLVHCLVPRTMYVAMFGPAGDLMWSTEPVSGPDLMNVVDDALLSARSNPDSPGQVRLLPGNLPVYLCSLRDDTKRLLAVLAVVCRANEARERKSPDFAFAYTLLSPMLECVRRELVTRATIDELNHTVGGLDRGMNLLLAYGGAEQSAAQADGANELQGLLQQTIEHLRARTGALIVPERNVTLVRAGEHAPADTQFLMRAHRRLLSLAQAQREPVVSNETLSAATPDALAYRVLCCSLRSRAGRFIGVRELLRQRLPPGAFGSRISGDRFVVLVPAEMRDSERFAESLREGAERLAMTHAAAHLPVSISVGVAPLDCAADELAHVLAAAETACKAAKDRGRNRVEAYHQSDQSIVRRYADIRVAAQLREAIDAGRLHLYAQLILPFATGDSARPHYELLLRMTDEDGRTVGPDSFLSAANRYQLMPTIDRWVINHVIEALKPRATVLEGKALGFAINFSGQSLSDDGFSDFLVERVAGSGLDPELFCFELTENATVLSLPRAEAL